MAERSINPEPNYVAAVTKALVDRYPGADVSHEQIRRDRYRFIIISEQFNSLGHPERQRAVWDLVEQTVAKEDLLKVGMIITISAEEAAMSSET